MIIMPPAHACKRRGRVSSMGTVLLKYHHQYKGKNIMTTVTLRIYDLSMGMAAQMSEPLLGKKIEYIPHT